LSVVSRVARLECSCDPWGELRQYGSGEWRVERKSHSPLSTLHCVTRLSSRCGSHRLSAGTSFASFFSCKLSLRGSDVGVQQQTMIGRREHEYPRRRLSPLPLYHGGEKNLYLRALRNARQKTLRHLAPEGSLPKGTVRAQRQTIGVIRGILRLE